MTPSLLREAGQYLHGERWRLPLAMDLGKSQWTVMRWERGEFRIPPEDAARVVGLVEAKRQAGSDLVRRLRGAPVQAEA